MNWACDAAQTGCKFICSQLQIIIKWVGMEHMTPKVVEVPLPGVRPDDVVPVPTFDFVSQLHSLLSDTKLNYCANLVINPNNPFLRYIPPDGCLKEALSGLWYNNAWDHMELHTNCNFMIPIVFYIDKTQISIAGKKIYPVQMSLSIFTEESRRTSRAWPPLGYVANEEFFFSNPEIQANTPNTKNQHLHRQLLKQYFNHFIRHKNQTLFLTFLFAWSMFPNV
jgi:hypothetical protein